MKRILVISPKDVFIAKRILDESTVLGIESVIVPAKDLAKQNLELLAESFDFLWVRFGFPYFDGVISLAKLFVKNGKRVVDADWATASPRLPLVASTEVNLSKAWMLDRLYEAGLSVPETDYYLAGSIRFPCIVKWVYGKSGSSVWFVKSESDVSEILKEFPAEELIWQEFVQAKYEYKVVAIGCESLPKIFKFKMKADGFKADFATREVVLSDEYKNVVDLAEKGSRVLGRELSKSDILEGVDGKLYLLEVNRSPGLRDGFEDGLGVNVVRGFLEYLLRVAG
jgi:glutathione synthase/RimK-type ligase-like ATP-grasp enzyme